MTLDRPLFTTAAALFISAFAIGSAVAQDSTPAAEAPAAAAETLWTWDWEKVELPQGQLVDDIVMGDESAPVTMIEYASFTCSHCSDFSTNVFGQLKADYIDTGKVRFIQRDVYFDAVGLGAGILARCNGEDKYHAVSEIIFADQGTWLNGKTMPEFEANLRKVGAKTGMTNEQMDACWADKQVIADLTTTFQANAGKDQIQGTPTFIINGEKVNNQPYDGLKTVLDAKLAEAEKQG